MQSRSSFPTKLNLEENQYKEHQKRKSTIEHAHLMTDLPRVPPGEYTKLNQRKTSKAAHHRNDPCSQRDPHYCHSLATFILRHKENSYRTLRRNLLAESTQICHKSHTGSTPMPTTFRRFLLHFFLLLILCLWVDWAGKFETGFWSFGEIELSLFSCSPCNHDRARSPGRE